jgi:hypothetical protein
MIRIKNAARRSITKEKENNENGWKAVKARVPLPSRIRTETAPRMIEASTEHPFESVLAIRTSRLKKARGRKKPVPRSTTALQKSSVNISSAPVHDTILNRRHRWEEAPPG